jgi:hypothetical protein
MCVGEISWLSVSDVQDRDARELSYIRSREHPQDVVCPSGSGRWGHVNFAITEF